MKKNKEIYGLSLFSGAGIGEAYLKKCGINIVVANEIIPKRADLYKAMYPDCQVIKGDINDDSVFKKIISASKNVDFLLASPPCQGMSIAGKGRNQDAMLKDKRNYLISKVFDAVNELFPSYVLIENVPGLLKFVFRYKNTYGTVMDILNKFYSDKYKIEAKVLDAASLGVPQVRKRAIIKMYKKDKVWKWPNLTSNPITVRDAIGHLPSLESGEDSGITWHFSRKHLDRQVECMKHTPTNHSAFENDVYYPKKSDGSRIKGYDTTYRRMSWDEPAPTITIRNDAISSQRNVHPGRKLKDGLYSDARVLTILELMILSSLPVDWPIPEHTPEILIRQVIGEAIPPLMVEKIVEGIEW